MFYYNWTTIYWSFWSPDVMNIFVEKYQPKNKQFDKMKKKWFFWAKHYKLSYFEEWKIFFPKWILDQIYERDYQELPNKYAERKIDLPSFDCTPYDYQQVIVDQLVSRKTWLVIAREWWGKTIVMAATIFQKKVPTLIVVPLVGIATGMLKKMQWYFWKDKVSIYKPGAKTTDITIAVWPTFNKYREMLQQDFEMLIIDEAHMNFVHTGPKKKKDSDFTDRMEVYCRFQCRYFFWFTATPESNDVDNNSFEYVFWKKIIAEWHQPNPKVLVYRYNDGIEMFRDRPHLQEILLEHQERISKLCEIVKQTMAHRWMWVVFCDRIEMVNRVCEELRSQWVECYSYTSKSQKRDEIVEKLRWKNWVIVATYQTLKAWVDYPELDTAFYFMWVKFSATVKQLIWRILRVESWKKLPIMVDFSDIVTPLYLQYRQRVAAYKSRWWWDPEKYSEDLVKSLSVNVM